MRHPLHPALVHFPVACWSLATLGDVASLHFGDPAWRFAGASMAIGTVAALAAMLAGLLEFARIGDDSPALNDARRHMLLAMAAWCCYATSLVLRLDGTALAPAGALPLGLSMLGFVLLAAAGWHGGKLVYTHGVGVRR
ncbi:MAG: DUF2231 domain-containing protein [Lysobacteraceae bacterium]|nr:MAG: DUF2231 domain-containing protein [Xanthomonadaceae bacterium]